MRKLTTLLVGAFVACFMLFAAACGSPGKDSLSVGSSESAGGGG